MIYLDYSATTMVDETVLETFNSVAKNYFANSNSIHKLGVRTKELIDEATKQISKELKIKPDEIIYTSSASESNNMAIKGISFKYKDRGKHIITTPFEHSSTVATLNYLSKLGYEISILNLNKDGTIDLKHLKKLIREDTILVTMSSVDSELGIRQDVEGIGKILKKYPKCFFHVDMTQCLGKDKIDLKDIDLASFSGHKIYCFKGIGGLYKKNNIVIEPLIHGGKSTTIYRSGTPQTELIVSFSKAIRLSLKDLDEKYNHVLMLNNKIKNNLSKYKNIKVNSTNKSIPHILNISIIGIKPETFVHALEEFDIYISTKSACSKSGELSHSVMALTKDELRSSHSVRISLSYKTTEEEIDEFLRFFKICYQNLSFE